MAMIPRSEFGEQMCYNGESMSDAEFHRQVSVKCGAYLRSKGYRTMREANDARKRVEDETGVLTVVGRPRLSEDELQMRRLENFLDYKALLDAERA